MSTSAKSPELTATRAPIPGVRISTVALVGIIAAVLIPVGAAAMVLSGSLEQKHIRVGISQAGPISKVVIDDANGSVKVVGDPTLIGVSGQADLNWQGSNQAPLALAQSAADGVLTLTKQCLNHDCGGADITISVPPGIAVQAVTTNGGIKVSNVSGGVHLETSNAGISVKDLGSGDAFLHTSNGGIDAAFTGAPKSIRAITSNGEVNIATDGKTWYDDDVDTSNGSRDIENNVDRKSTNEIYVRTSNGSINVK
ncbi:MAG: DUF4097 family beta strand repeat protein [Catenulispora sp.]|nr:DUF4097 family beta strand repeat protein [Catenulispora sp.]